MSLCRWYLDRIGWRPCTQVQRAIAASERPLIIISSHYFASPFGHGLFGFAHGLFIWILYNSGYKLGCHTLYALPAIRFLPRLGFVPVQRGGGTVGAVSEALLTGDIRRIVILGHHDKATNTETFGSGLYHMWHLGRADIAFLTLNYATKTIQCSRFTPDMSFDRDTGASHSKQFLLQIGQTLKHHASRPGVDVELNPVVNDADHKLVMQLISVPAPNATSLRTQSVLYRDLLVAALLLTILTTVFIAFLKPRKGFRFSI